MIWEGSHVWMGLSPKYNDLGFGQGHGLVWGQDGTV